MFFSHIPSVCCSGQFLERHWHWRDMGSNGQPQAGDGLQPSSVLYLEERIRHHEATLQSQQARRDQLLQEQKQAMQRKQRFLDQRTVLHNRYQSLLQTRTKNTSLGQSLRDSLSKSRERLQRLTTLEAMMDALGGDEQEQGESQTDDHDDITMMSTLEKVQNEERPEAETVEKTAAIEIHPPPSDSESGDDSNVTELKKDSIHEKIQNDTKPRGYHEMVDVHSFEWLRKYHGMPMEVEASSDNKAYMPFLPCLSASQVHDYMLLSIREANGLDIHNADFGMSLRRELFEGTCLGVRLLASNTAVLAKGVADGSTVDDGSTEQDSTISAFDPNLSLCPYELAGTCADKLCPYQHITKEPKIVARERLPLPRIKLLLTEDKDLVDALKEGGDGDVDLSIASDDEMDGCLQRPRPSVVADVLDDTKMAEENFIVLPNSIAERVPSDDSDNEMCASSQSINSQCLQSDKMSCPMSQFWWGGWLPEYRASALSSVNDIFQQTFKVSIEGVNIKFEDRDFGISQADCFLAAECRNLGRLVEATQFAIHTGRYDVAFSLCNFVASDVERQALAHAEVSLVRNEVLQHALAGKLKALVLKAFRRDSGSSHSELQNMFLIQIGMTVLSVVLERVATFVEEVLAHDGAFGSTSLEALVALFQRDMFSGKVTDTPAQTNANAFDIQNLHNILDSNTREQPKSTTELVRCCALDIDKLEDLHRWADRMFGQFKLDPNRLDKYWSAISSFLRKNDDETEKSQGKNRLHFLQGVVVGGDLLLCCLSYYAKQAITGEVQYDVWSLLDSSVLHILSDIQNHAKLNQTWSFLLAPLWSSSAILATLLSKYANAQQRLEIQLNPFSQDDSLSKRYPISIFHYSELLWSQLLQLRINLPNDVSMPYEEDVTNGPFDRSTNALKGVDSPPLWEPSEETKQIVKQISEYLRKSGIRPHHLGLCGDELLFTLGQTHIGGTFELMYFASTDSVPVQHSCDNTHDAARALNFSGTAFSHHLNVFHLPLQILNLGRRLKTLDLSQTRLSCLPNSFGWYFQDLEMLDLSNNCLEELPESFQRLAKHMGNLTTILMRGNKLKKLPERMFLAAGPDVSPTKSSLRILDVSYNHLTVFPRINSFVYACLEEVRADGNNLKGLSMADLSNLVSKIKTLRLVSFDYQGEEPCDTMEHNQECEPPITSKAP